MDISQDSGKEYLFRECMAFCNALTEKGWKYSISRKLGQSFEFSLKNEKCAPPKAKKRSLSSLRRQLRRKEKEDWLSSRECWCSSRTLQRKARPPSKTSISEKGSVDSTTDYDAIQQWAADVSTVSPGARCPSFPLGNRGGGPSVWSGKVWLNS